MIDYTLPYLTAREKEIVDIMSKGVSAKECAEKLFVSIKTIQFHTRQMYLKYNVHSMVGLLSAIGEWKMDEKAISPKLKKKIAKAEPKCSACGRENPHPVIINPDSNSVILEKGVSVMLCIVCDNRLKSIRAEAEKRKVNVTTAKSLTV